METGLAFTSATEIRRLFLNKELSPVELTRLFLDRIDAIDGQLNSYLTISAEEALFVFAENQWPQVPPDFQQAWETCYQAMSLFSGRLMKLFALALKLPQNYFEEYLRQPISALRANHYPALLKTPLEGQLRAGAHSDYGSLTLLFQEEGLSGLEILNRQKEWVPVKPCKPDIIVNLGDLMERWTNGHWVSTLHRVVTPDSKKDSSHSRMSLVFF